MKLGMVYGRGSAMVAEPEMKSQIPADAPIRPGDIVSFVRVAPGQPVADAIPFTEVEQSSGYYFVRRESYSDSSIYARPTGSHREFLLPMK